MNSKGEREIILKVEKLAKIKSFDDICFEIGRFIEKLAEDIYFDNKGKKPKSAKASIDYLITNKLIPNILGHKFHVIRELRNVVAHKLPYRITQSDARIAIDTLNETFEWLYQGNIAEKWNKRVLEIFSEGEKLLNQGNTGDKENLRLELPIMMLYGALENAVFLKLKSLGLELGKIRGFFSAVELLANQGIQVRNPCWRQLVDLRNHIVHPPSDFEINDKDIELLTTMIPEFQKILEILNPLTRKESDLVGYPQVSVNI